MKPVKPIADKIPTPKTAKMPPKQPKPVLNGGRPVTVQKIEGV